ncbi:hypothetical protein [Plantactinospora mayteni]|nr:hypothetical protein [Plantactinospora mayteni]
MAVTASEDTGLLIAASVISDGYFVADPGLYYRKWPGQMTGQAAHRDPAEHAARMQGRSPTLRPTAHVLIDDLSHLLAEVCARHVAHTLRFEHRIGKAAHVAWGCLAQFAALGRWQAEAQLDTQLVEKPLDIRFVINALSHAQQHVRPGQRHDGGHGRTRRTGGARRGHDGRI